MIGSFLSPTGVAPWLVKMFVIWSPYHFSGQTLGISLIYARRAGIRVGRGERLALSGFIFATFLVQTAITEAGQGPGQLLLGLLSDLRAAGLGARRPARLDVGLRGRADLLLCPVEPAGRASWRPPILLLPAATQFVWFGLGWKVPAFNEFVPFFHALQYMLIAWVMQIGESLGAKAPADRRRFVLGESLRWGLFNIAGGIVLFWVLPRAGRAGGLHPALRHRGGDLGGPDPPLLRRWRHLEAAKLEGGVSPAVQRRRASGTMAAPMRPAAARASRRPDRWLPGTYASDCFWSRTRWWGAAPQAQAQPARPRVGEERILFRTNRGDLVLGLYPEVAPRTTAQILNLVRLGVYDSVWFHRVEPGFVAQITDARNRKNPLSPEQVKALVKLPAELSPVPHQSGVLSMARQNEDINSAESSFSFLLGPAPHLDGKYTVFGQVEWGMPLLAMVAGEPRDARNAPRYLLMVESAVVKTDAEIASMIQAGELRRPRRLPDSAPAAVRVERIARAGVRGCPPRHRGGSSSCIVCNLAGFAFGNRWPPQTRGALNLLPVLIGFFLLLSQLGSSTARAPLLGLALFFGVVGLFKLMNRFESTPPSDRPAAK